MQRFRISGCHQHGNRVNFSMVEKATYIEAAIKYTVTTHFHPQKYTRFTKCNI